MARKMNGNAGHARGAFAANERGGRRANTSQTQCEPPFFPQQIIHFAIGIARAMV